MEKLLKLMHLLEITRLQPQYGYGFAGGNERIGNLAEHQYLVAMIGWQLAVIANKAGAKFDTEKVIKFCLLHDIGELFGGDISMYYARVNPTAKKFAMQFEEENQRFISSFFPQQDEVKEITKEILDSQSDEAHIAKLADYIEVTHYKLFIHQIQKSDIELVAPKLKEKVNKISDTKGRKELLSFIQKWKNDILKYNSFLDATISALEYGENR